MALSDNLFPSIESRPHHFPISSRVAIARRMVKCGPQSGTQKCAERAVCGSNPYAPTNTLNNLQPLRAFPVTPNYAIRVKKWDNLPYELSPLYSALKSLLGPGE